MDCVYHAWAQHYLYLEMERNGVAGVDRASRDKFYELRQWIQGNDGPLFGGFAPFVVYILAVSHGYLTRTQYRIWTPEHYETQCENELQRDIVRLFGDAGEVVENIALQPAIYLDLSTQHAQFAHFVPNMHNTVMAIQLWK